MRRLLHGKVDLFFLDVVLLDVAGEDQGQSAVAGDVASGTEGILQGEDGEHQSRAGITEAQDGDDETQRGNDRAAGDAGGADCEHAQQHAEEHHGARCRQRAVENLGDHHDEEDFRQNRAAEVDIGKQRDTKVDHITAEGRGLLGAAQGNGQGGSGRHGAHSSEVSRAIVLDHLDGIGLGIRTGKAIEQRQPDVMADHDNDDDNEEDGKLLGDGALIGQRAEGAGDEDGQDGDDNLGDDLQHDILELLEYAGNGLCLDPGGSQAD